MTFILIIVGAILVWACPNKATWSGNTFNLDLIGKIVFWVGLAPTLVVLAIWLLGLIGVAVAVPWRSSRRR